MAALAAEGASLRGSWTADELARWHATQTPPEATEPPPVQWAVRGETRRPGAPDAQIWLHLQVSALAWLTCQRCLQPFSQPLQVERAIRWVADEREAEALDADSEDDVLALVPAPDLRTLVEDELLLACPIVPRHAACELPPHAAGPASAAEGGPFAGLARLKAGRGGLE